MEYLKQVEHFGIFCYSRDPVIKEYENVNLKMVSMFLNKFLSTFNLKETFENNAQGFAKHKKLKMSLADLLIKIAIHEGNSETARVLFTEWF